ncbi:ORF6C domain-containing protein [Aerococcus sanguinicola]
MSLPISPAPIHSTELLQIQDALHTHNIYLTYICDRLEYLEKEQPIHPSISTIISKVRKEQIINQLGGKDAPAYQDKKLVRSVYQEAAKDYKRHFQITRYDLLPRRAQKEGLQYWTKWQPSDYLKEKIRKANSYD